MNGFKLEAETYHKVGDEKKARIYDFLATCDDEDFCTMFDSTAFNDTAKGYLRLALRELVEEGEIDEDQASSVRARYNALFSEMTAADVNRALGWS